MGKKKDNYRKKHANGSPKKTGESEKKSEVTAEKKADIEGMENDDSNAKLEDGRRAFAQNEEIIEFEKPKKRDNPQKDQGKDKRKATCGSEITAASKTVSRSVSPEKRAESRNPLDKNKRHDGDKRASGKNTANESGKKNSVFIETVDSVDTMGVTDDKVEIGMKKSVKKKIIISVAVCILAIAAVVLISKVAKYVKAYNVAREVLADVQYTIPESYDLSLNAVDGYINFLLLGSDSRNLDAIEKTRTDMIIIASLNEETYEVKLTSIYRDTYLKLGDTSTYDKITHAGYFGGPELALKSINQALDLDIEKFVLVNFRAVADLVDAVGGVEIDVKENELEQLNLAIGGSAIAAGRERFNYVDTHGMQTLDGPQAVAYGRIRYNVGGDLKRAERMRTVAEAVLLKLRGMNFDEIKKIVDIVKPSIKMNLDMNDVLGLAYRIPKYKVTASAGWPYNLSMGYIGDVSYVFPETLKTNVSKLHRELFNRENYVPSNTSNTISNGIIAKRRVVPVVTPPSEELPPTNPDEGSGSGGTGGGSGGTGGGSGGSGGTGGGSGGSGGTGGGSGDGTGGGGDGTGGGGDGTGGGGDGTGGGGDGTGGSGDGTGGGGDGTGGGGDGTGGSGDGTGGGGDGTAPNP